MRVLAANYPVHSLLFYHVSGNLKIRAYESMCLRVRYMDVKLIVRDGQRLVVFQGRAMTRVLVRTRQQVTWN